MSSTGMSSHKRSRSMSSSSMCPKKKSSRAKAFLLPLAIAVVCITLGVVGYHLLPTGNGISSDVHSARLGPHFPQDSNFTSDSLDAGSYLDSASDLHSIDLRSDFTLHRRCDAANPCSSGNINPGQQNPQINPAVPIIELSEAYILSNFGLNTSSDAILLAEQCSVANPCVDGSCCSGDNTCGYGPVYCGTGCTSNCDALAMCGRYSGMNGTIPCGMNICCSFYGWCGTSEAHCGDVDPNLQAPCQVGFGLCEIIPPPSCSPSDETTNGRTIGYYQASNVQSRLCETITPSQIILDGYTHLYFAFATIDPTDYSVVPVDPSDVQLYTEFTALSSPTLETWIAIGGFDFSDAGGPTHTTWSNLSATAATRATFITSLITFMDQYNFQGVDIDWEYPSASDRGGQYADMENYVSLVREMRTAFGTKYGLSLTLAPDYWYLRGFDAISMQPYVDWFGFMAYDLHGSWDSDVLALGSLVRGQTDIQEIYNDTQPLWFDKLDPSKINMGLAYYGRGYTLSNPACNQLLCPFSGPSNPGPCTNFAGVMSLIEIETLIIEKSLVPELLAAAMMKQITWDDQWIGYDDNETIAMKKTWADGYCFGGTMAWSVDFNSGVGSGSVPSQANTTDGTCGEAYNGTVCGDWPSGNCCSASGFCGTGSAYCGSGCQSGSCSEGEPTSDGTCGAAYRNDFCGTWPQGPCCSSAGFCGNDTAHCGTGCQSGCPTTDGTCGINNGGTSCIGFSLGECCSSSGFCGATEAFCGSGCQSGPCLIGQTTDGTCGAVHGGTVCGDWSQGGCCSSYGLCGNDTAHCGAGCQSGPCSDLGSAPSEVTTITLPGGSITVVTFIETATPYALTEVSTITLPNGAVTLITAIEQITAVVSVTEVFTIFDVLTLPDGSVTVIPFVFTETPASGVITELDTVTLPDGMTTVIPFVFTQAPMPTSDIFPEFWTVTLPDDMTTVVPFPIQTATITSLESVATTHTSNTLWISNTVTTISGTPLPVVGVDPSSHTGTIIWGLDMGSQPWNTVFSLPGLPKMSWPCVPIPLIYSCSGPASGSDFPPPPPPDVPPETYGGDNPGEEPEEQEPTSTSSESSSSTSGCTSPTAFGRRSTSTDTPSCPIPPGTWELYLIVPVFDLDNLKDQLNFASDLNETLGDNFTSTQQTYVNPVIYSWVAIMNSTQVALFESNPVVAYIVPFSELEDVVPVDDIDPEFVKARGWVQFDWNDQLNYISQAPDTEEGSTYVLDESQGEGVAVYIYDRGVDINHEEFAGKSLDNPNNWIFPGGVGTYQINGGPAMSCIQRTLSYIGGHGTAMAAGVAGAKLGVAKNANLKILQPIATSAPQDQCIWYIYQYQAILAIMDDISTNGSPTKSVVQIALAFFSGLPDGAYNNPDTPHYMAYRNILASGVSVVMASGNNALGGEAGVTAPTPDISAWPMKLATTTDLNIIVVGGVNADGSVYPRTQGLNQDRIDVFALATNVLEAEPGGSLVYRAGTSPASAAVSGLVAYFLGLPSLQAQINAQPASAFAAWMRQYITGLAYPRMAGGPKVIYNGAPADAVDSCPPPPDDPSDESPSGDDGDSGSDSGSGSDGGSGSDVDSDGGSNGNKKKRQACSPPASSSPTPSTTTASPTTSTSPTTSAPPTTSTTSPSPTTSASSTTSVVSIDPSKATAVPAACLNECNNLSLLWQDDGESGIDCGPTSDAAEDLAACKACMSAHGDNQGDASIIHSFPNLQQFFDFCTGLS